MEVEWTEQRGMAVLVLASDSSSMVDSVQHR
jgi:hypothetical protein